MFGKTLSPTIIIALLSVYSAGLRACAVDGNGIQRDTLILSTVNPVLTIRPDLEKVPEALEIEITVLENDSLINFFIEVHLIAAGHEAILLGSATPFPIDTGGRFIFGTGKAFEGLIEENEEALPDSLKLILTLRQESMAGTIVVRIDSVLWRYPEN
jgi:hypothetical protein